VEHLRPSIVVAAMIDPKRPADQNAAPETVSPTRARAGTTGNKVLYVLIVSVIIAALAMLFTYVVSPKGSIEGATSAPGPY
jgi:cell division protein FtsL